MRKGLGGLPIVFLVWALLIGGLSFAAEGAANCGDCLSPDRARALVGPAATLAVGALKRHDMQTLSRLVHPVKGVRFSPYAFLDTDNDIRFTSTTVRSAFSDAKPYTWGAYDGSGDPIRLPFRAYYSRFVYDRDYAADPGPSYNFSTVKHGGASDNAREEYPDAVIVEFHAKPQENDAGSRGRALRLVFEPYKNSWYLVHIVHDEWTI